MLRFLVLAALVACSLGAAPRPRRPRLDGRIVGGSDADIADYPYQLSFQYYGSHMCGASIISNTYAVTAAHCVDGVNANEVQVLAGTSSLSAIGGVYHVIESLVANPQYDYYTIDFDVAVIKVSAPFAYGPQIGPVSLTSGEPGAGAVAVISGWGTTASGGSLPDQLQVVSIPIVDHDECDADYEQYGGITDNMICAAVEEGGKDSCQGDSGGPLVVDGKLAGIVSWGVGCAQAGYPGVYSNVATLKSFITEETGVN